MIEITKVHWAAEGDNVKLSMPVSKVDKEQRLVHGFASLDNLDTQDDIVLSTASSKAFSRFRGNIREMHQPIAVGKMVSYKEDSFFDKDGTKYNGVYVSVYVSKGAQDTWEKVLDGTLTGFSIGGNIIDSTTEIDKAIGRPVRKINDFELTELSLVDNPANQKANIFSIQKMADGTEKMTGILVETTSETAFYCPTDEIVKTSTEQKLICPSCDKQMTNVGWFEYSTDEEKTEKLASVVQNYLSNKNNIEDNEGGVDMAEDTVEKATPSNDKDIEVVEEGKAETEVESSVENDESANDVSEVEDAEEDLAKMISSLSNQISEDFKKNRKVIDEALSNIDEKVESMTKEIDGKITELSNEHSRLSEKFATIKDEFGKMEKNVNELVEKSAVRKSESLGGDKEEVIEKSNTSTSKWGGIFL